MISAISSKAGIRQGYDDVRNVPRRRRSRTCPFRGMHRIVQRIPIGFPPSATTVCPVTLSIRQ
jgi:hypothetical protein